MNTIFKNIEYQTYTKEDKSLNKANVTNEQSKREVMKTAVEHMKEMIDKSGFETEEDKQKYEKGLNEKIKLGKELSQSEMNYLQRSNPILYSRIKRVQLQREMLKTKLNQCKSKKEVEETYSQATATIDKKDPDKQMVMSAYNNVTKEFKNTSQYKFLPADIKKQGN